MTCIWLHFCIQRRVRNLVFIATWTKWKGRYINGQRCLAFPFDINAYFSGNKIDIPSFSRLSYLQYIGLQRSVLSYTEIMLIVKPHQSRSGLLLYNGYSRNGTGDFLAIYLENGFVIFSFDLGTGHAFIRYQYFISTLYFIKLSSEYCFIMILIRINFCMQLTKNIWILNQDQH